MSTESKQPQQSEEVDLGQLFRLIGNAFERFFNFIGNIFYKLFLGFVWLVFFVKKHLLKLIIAGVIGVGLGVYFEKTGEPVYKSFFTVKQNYDTGEDLYNTVSYFNDLVKQGDTITLGATLGVTPGEAAKILGFEVGSLISENERLKEYDTYIKTLDTMVSSSITYEDYLLNDKEYDHKVQQISIKAKERNNFKLVFEKVVEGVNSNEYFINEQAKDVEELSNIKLALEIALIKSDSLQNTYKRVLEKSIEKESEIGITFEGNNNIEKTKEFDLYKNDLELRRELVEIERELLDKKDIVEIISSKQESGFIDNRKEILGKSLGYKAYYATLISFLVFLGLIIFEFIKFLERFKN
ncbi:hypothetical protein [Algibacter mikhailovii]|uniref:Uncharacterized protein n=1 Tax=Algibacter mikhailovii TaxID=425498 RepID=A0A918VBQ4_9FLAO|nr:hypothetical protein [Algibacter mikhailovii]GGZ89316.1 hypothetical protein GCM10007028_29460 [Algibacter mikhailovii]